MRLAEFKTRRHEADISATRHETYISFGPRPTFYLKSNGVEINDVNPVFLFPLILGALHLDVMASFPYGLSVSDRIGPKRRIFNMICFEIGRCPMSAMTKMENIEISSLYDQTLFSLIMGQDANNGLIWMVGTVPALL